MRYDSVKVAERWRRLEPMQRMPRGCAVCLQRFSNVHHEEEGYEADVYGPYGLPQEDLKERTWRTVARNACKTEGGS